MWSSIKKPLPKKQNHTVIILPPQEIDSNWYPKKIRFSSLPDAEPSVGHITHIVAIQMSWYFILGFLIKSVLLLKCSDCSRTIDRFAEVAEDWGFSNGLQSGHLMVRDERRVDYLVCDWSDSKNRALSLVESCDRLRDQLYLSTSSCEINLQKHITYWDWHKRD